MGLEHGVEQALQEANLVGCVRGRELRDGIRGRVDEGVVPHARRLVRGATDLEVEGGEGMVGGGDVGVKVGGSDVFGEGLAAFCLW